MVGNNWNKTLISVIIPTRNRATLLATALDSLTRQDLRLSAFEVLIIDNGSNDQTFSVAQTYVEKFPNFRYFQEQEPGLHAGRHKGMLEAYGNILVFADDDIEALPSWLETIHEVFADRTVAMLGGNNLPLFTISPPPWLKLLWLRSSFHGGRSLPPLSILEIPGHCRSISPFYIWGCNFSIRKDVLLAAGGFHPDGMPNELIHFRGDGETHVSRYVQAAGLTSIFHPGASVYHKVTPERMTFGYFRQRGFNQGISNSYTALRDQNFSVSRKSNILSRAAYWCFRKSKEIFFVNAKMKNALNEFYIGQKEGYAYHQQLYRDVAEIREWVHKPKYF